MGLLRQRQLCELEASLSHMAKGVPIGREDGSKCDYERNCIGWAFRFDR
jgi:hypothetical protein